MTQEKILIIDDEADLVESIARNLEADGFQTIRAFSGADGLRKATDEHPDLILLDVAMRDLNGYEVLTKIKDRGIPTRVIVFTGYATSLRDVVKFIKAGACDYLIKGQGATVLVMDAVKRSLAVETTINLHVSDTTPIVEQLIAAAEKLSKDKDRLQIQNTALVKNENRASILMVAIRLLCLLIAVGLTALLSSSGLVSKTWVFLLPVVLFALLILPLERVKTLYLKAPSTEGKIEM
jgi:DNA-binding response OmpR family regulator